MQLSVNHSAPSSRSGKRRKSVSAGRVAIYVVLAVYTLWILFPFFVILVTSLTSVTEYQATTGYVWFPKKITLDGYKRLFVDDPFMRDGIPSILRGFFNTMWITLIPLFSGLFQSLLVSYCYSKWDFPCKNALFLFTVTLMFIPLNAFNFVGYMFYQNIGWTEGPASVLPLIVPGLFAGAGTIFFLRPYVDGINGEIIEAAKIDGMGFWKIFFSVVVPLSKPALIAQFIFGFVGGYNNYSGALMYLNSLGTEDFWTLQLAMQKLIDFNSSGDSDYAFSCATALMGMLPLMAVYFACQRFFIEGLAFGGGKE